MAHQDYVARSKQQKNKKHNPYKKAPAEPSGMSFKAKVIAVVTVILLLSFAYGLWSIKDNVPSSATDQPPTPVAETIKKTDKVEIPVFNQDDEFDFMSDLKEKEVEAGKYEVNDLGPFLMQCGSFRKRSQAEALKANIAFSGISSQVKQTNGSNGLWYKVVLGPYERKRLAESDKHKLSRNKINGCQIWLWR